MEAHGSTFQCRHMAAPSNAGTWQHLPMEAHIQLIGRNADLLIHMKPTCSGLYDHRIYQGPVRVNDEEPMNATDHYPGHIDSPGSVARAGLQSGRTLIGLRLGCIVPDRGLHPGRNYPGYVGVPLSAPYQVRVRVRVIYRLLRNGSSGNQTWERRNLARRLAH